MARASVLSFIILIPCLIHVSNAEGPRTDLVWKQCRNGRAKNMPDYIESYQKMLGMMRKEMYHNKFSFMEDGEAPNRLHLLAQCMEDLSSQQCETCFTHINSLLPGCFPNTGARVYLDGCFIRAENYSFFRETILPNDTKHCSSNFNYTPEFRQTAKEVIIKLALKAPNYGGFAEEHAEVDDNVSFFGMASCVRTLDSHSCAECLQNASLAALSCLPSTEGRALNSGCFLRYSDYEFANDPNAKKDQDESLSYVLYILASVALCTLAVVVGFFTAVIYYTRREDQRAKLRGMNIDSSVYRRSMQFLQFEYSTLEKATNNFNEANKLGQGGFGEVFKGNLQDGREIAIKRLSVIGKCRSEDIYNEMDIISKAQHKNLVRFLGCCFTNIDSYLVYEYLANRSLDRVLFDPEKKKELEWKKRLGIILGTAEGLEYLHTYCQVRIIHRDIKASNILLDLKHRPKIADFGLARFYSCDKNLISTTIAGTLGYMAPEYIAEGRLTEKVDVYSFGVLVLEIVSGVQNSKFQSEESLDTLVTNAWKHFQTNTVSEIIDKSIEIEEKREIERVIQMGLLCTQELQSLRPTMSKVIKMLREKDEILPVPTKPAYVDEPFETSICSTSKRPSNITEFSIYFSPQHPSSISDLCKLSRYSASQNSVSDPR